jgi:hypothetical protein
MLAVNNIHGMAYFMGFFHKVGFSFAFVFHQGFHNFSLGAYQNRVRLAKFHENIFFDAFLLVFGICKKTGKKVKKNRKKESKD